MKTITVSFDGNGKIKTISNNCVFFEQEDKSVKITATFTDIGTKSVRAYVKDAKNNSYVSEIITATSGTYNLTVSSDYMSKGTLYIGFEIFDTDGYTERLEPIKIYIDSFVNLGTGNSNNVYVVTAKVGTVTTLAAGANATVTNSGTNKDLILDFGIPQGIQGIQGLKGDKGDKGDTGAQGIQGVKGDTGNNGYTPVRGTDYWTATDIASISTDLDNKIANALIQDTASGTTAQTEFALETTAKNYRIYGNCTQNGTPTPTAPIEIECVGDLVTDIEDINYGKYKIQNRVCGKNLVPSPYSDPIRTRNGITYTVNSDGTIVANGTATGGRSYFVIQDYIKLPVGTYRMCGCPSGGSTTTYSIYCDIYESSTWKSEPYDTGNGTTINVVNNQYKLKSFTINIANGTTVNNLVFKPQIELGSTATEYEPYRESTITTYLDEPLRKVGAYADYIDWKTQKVVRKIETKTFVETEETYSFSANNYVTYGIANVLYPNGGAISNRYIKMVGSSDLSIASKSYGLQITDSTNTSSLNGWKSKLAEWNTAGNPLKVYYVLATPTEENITLSPMPLKEDVNNISCTTTTQTSNIEVTYYQNPTKVINSVKNLISGSQGVVNNATYDATTETLNL